MDWKEQMSVNTELGCPRGTTGAMCTLCPWGWNWFMSLWRYLWAGKGKGAHELGPLRDAERWAPGGPVFACQVWALLHVPEPREGKPASLRRTTGIMMGSAPGEAGSSWASASLTLSWFSLLFKLKALPNFKIMWPAFPCCPSVHHGYLICLFWRGNCSLDFYVLW